MSKELTKDEFIQHLVDVGWSLADAQAEWERIQTEEDESGYDGP